MDREILLQLRMPKMFYSVLLQDFLILLQGKLIWKPLCSLVVTCWERTGLLALFYVVFSCVFVTFSYDVLGQVQYLIVSIPDLCLTPYFTTIYMYCLS